MWRQTVCRSLDISFKLRHCTAHRHSHESNDACNSLPAALPTACDVQDLFERMCMAKRGGAGEFVACLIGSKDRVRLIFAGFPLETELQLTMPGKNV